MKGMRRGLCGAVLVGLLGAGCLATAGPGAAGAGEPKVPQVTVAEAASAFAELWPKFDTAFAQGQLMALSKYATGNLLLAASGATGCGCSWTTPHSKVLYSIPVEHAYPVSFLAQISTPAPKRSVFSPFTTIVVFTKSRAHAPWLVAYLVRYAGAHGYLTSSSVRAAPQATFPITEVVGQLAEFFTSITNTGSPPADDSWPQTGSTGQEVQEYLDTKSSVERLGVQQTTLFSGVDTSAAFAYPHGDIMCGNYRSASTVTAGPGTPIVQPSDQITWGAKLAPGTYASLNKLGMHQVCYIVDTTADPTRDMVRPLSFFESVYQVTGQPG